MTFKSQALADISSVWLNTAELGENAAYQPEGFTGTFPLILCLGDIDDTMVSLSDGEIDQKRMPAFGLLSIITAGIQAITGIASAPRKGDAVTFASSASAAIASTVWTVERHLEDEAGGVTIWLRRENRQSLAGAGVVETR